MKFRDRVAVVTGGGSGMGQELVLELLRRGCSGVAFCDVNWDGLNETSRLAAKENGKVKGYRVDVGDQEAMHEFAREVMKDFDGKVHLLFANAGIAATGVLVHPGTSTREEVERDEKNWDRCFHVDYFGVLYSVRAFLPMIVAQDEGHVVITSSLNAIWTWPSHGAYTAAKWGVAGLAEALLCETYVKAPHVHVSCVHPGGVKTGIVKNAIVEDRHAHIQQQMAKEVDKNFDLYADEAARWILDGVQRNQTRIIVGYDAMFLQFAQRLAPHRLYDLYKALGREGVSAFHPDQHELLAQQVEALTFFQKLRILGSSWYFLLMAAPIPIIQTARKIKNNILSKL